LGIRDPVEEELGAADADPQPAAQGSETCALGLGVAGVFLHAQPRLTGNGHSYYNTAATRVAPPPQATPPPQASPGGTVLRSIQEEVDPALAGSSLPEAAAANMLATGEEMVDAALAASQARRAPQPEDWIPEFIRTEEAKAIWCDIEVEQCSRHRVWTKWEDEWYYLEGPDPRFNVWDRTRHSWVKKVWVWSSASSSA